MDNELIEAARRWCNASAEAAAAQVAFCNLFDPDRVFESITLFKVAQRLAVADGPAQEADSGRKERQHDGKIYPRGECEV